MIADGKVDQLLYYKLINDPTPIKPEHRHLIVRRIRETIVAGEEGGRVIEKVVPGKESLGDIRLTPLTLAVSTDRGVDTVVYRTGEPVNLSVVTSIDAHVFCYYQQSDGQIMKLYPNRFQPSSETVARKTLRIPGDAPYQIIPERLGSTLSSVMCMAAYEDIDKKLPFQLSEKHFQALPVESLEEIHGYYQAVADTIPLMQRINIEVQ